LLVRVGVTLRNAISAERDSYLVAGAVRADVPGGFSHASTMRPLAELLATVAEVTDR